MDHIQMWGKNTELLCFNHLIFYFLFLICAYLLSYMCCFALLIPQAKQLSYLSGVLGMSPQDHFKVTEYILTSSDVIH